MMVSIHLVIVVCLLCRASAESQDGGDKNIQVTEKSDPKSITKLLDTLENLDHDSDVFDIIKNLESTERVTTATIPKPTSPSGTTQSPFFKTERPLKFSTRLEKEGNLNEMIAYIDRSVMEAQNEVGPGVRNVTKEDMQIIRKSDSHHHHHHLHPPIGNLMWSTAQAVWDVSRPVLRHTTVGRNVAFVKNTVTLPLRTLGAIRHRVHDLYHHPYGRRHRSLFHHDHHGWDDHHHHHGHGHGWGDSDVVYVKYEPDNSLFKSWLRYLYRAIRPAAITKIRLHRHLLRTQLRFLRRTLYRAVATKIRLIRNRFRPKVVVVKEVVKAPHHHSWGGGHHYHHHGWGWPTPPPPTSPPKPRYGPPQPPPPMYADLTYGSSEQSPYYTHSNYYADSKASSEMHSPQPGYGPPSPPPPQESYGPPKNKAASPVNYNQENRYQSHTSPWLMSPEHMLIQGSEKQETSTSADIDTPSYATYLKDFGIDPATLENFNPLSFKPSSSAIPGNWNLIELEKINLKNSEDVPYLRPNSEEDNARKDHYDNNAQTNGDVDW